jgi:hypothetical protein
MTKNFLLYLLLFIGLTSCKTKQAITPLDYAMLSAHVYDDNDRPLPKNFETFVEHDDEKEGSFAGMLNGFVRGLDIDKVMALSQNEEKGKLISYLAVKAVAGGGYYGQAYIEQSTSTVIIAHRGTDNLIEAFVGSDKVDIKTGKRLWSLVRDLDDDYEIYSGKIPRDQFLQARAFTRKVKRAYEKEYGQEPQIIHTGHSLGAILAELCAVADQGKAITFESPGSAPLIEELGQIVSSFDYGSFNSSQVDITTYNAEPNSINTLHQHLGKVVPLYKTKRKLSSYSEDVLIDNLYQHSIDTILIRFNPRTGRPK